MQPQKNFTVNPGWAVLLTDLGLDPAGILNPGKIFDA